MADEENSLGGQVGLDTTGFKAGVTDLNRQIRVIETGFQAAAAGMGDWSKSSDGLQQRIESLNKVSDLQKQKLEALTQKYDDAAASGKASQKQLDDMQISINGAAKAYNKTELEISQYIAKLNDVERESNQSSDDTDKLSKNLNQYEKEAKQAESSTKQLGDQMDKSSKSTSGFGDKVKSALSNVGSGIATGIKATATAIAGMGTMAVAAAAGTYKLAESASDLNEAQNVVQQTFKSSSEDVIKWTDGISQSAGISKTAATSMVGSMGAMLKSSGLSEQSASNMSEKMVQLSGDMASFYNLDNDTAWEKIRSGIAGETEPLKQLGINMSVANLQAYALSQGLQKPYDKMTQAEQTQLRYNYLLSVTADAQGDFTRTSGGMANQARMTSMLIDNLKTSIGLLVMPAVNGFLKELNTAIGNLTTSLTKALKTGDFTEFGNVLSNTISGAVTKITSGMDKFMPMVTQLLTGLISALVQAIPAVLPALSAAVVQLIQSVSTILQQNGPMLIQTAVTAVTTIVSGLIQNLPLLVDAAIQMILALVDALTQQIPTLIPVAINAVITIANSLIDHLPELVQAAIQLVMALIQGLMKALPQLYDEIPKIIMGLVQALVDSLPMIIDAAPKIIVSIITGLINALPQIIMYAPKIIIALVSGLIQAIPQLLTIGPQIYKGLLDGLRQMNWGELGGNIIRGILDGFGQIGNWIWNAVRNVGSSIVNGFKNFFGIHSPSTLMRDMIGKNLGYGMVDGIKATIGDVEGAMSQLNAAATGTVSVNGTVNGSTANGNTVYNNYGAAQEVTTLNVDGRAIETVIRPRMSYGLSYSNLNYGRATGNA